MDMGTIRAKTKEVKGIVLATFPDYKRRDVVIQPTETITFHDLNWSGGTKSEYRACTVDGRSITGKYDMGAPAPWNNPFEGKSISIPEGAVIVEGGYFCGKPRILHIYVNPANMPKMLTA